MSDPQREHGLQEPPADEPSCQGPNLFRIYVLMALALLLAIAVAALIVWPFYKAR